MVGGDARGGVVGGPDRRVGREHEDPSTQIGDEPAAEVVALHRPPASGEERRRSGDAVRQCRQGVDGGPANVGGQRLFIGEQSYDIRGIGLVRDVHDIENIVVSEAKGVPVRVRDVGNVELGYAPRLGMVGHDSEPDVVQGIVLMRYGGETPHALEGVHARLEYIKKYHLLPPGMAQAR